MPAKTPTTVNPFSASGTTSAEGLLTGTGKPGSHAATGAATSAGPLTPTLAKHMFRVTTQATGKPSHGAPSKPTKRSRPEKGANTIPILQKGKVVHKDVSTRTAALQFISQLSTEPHDTKTTHPDLWHQFVTGLKGMFTGHGFRPETVKTVTLPYTVAGEKGLRGQFRVTDTLHAIINTVARSVLKDPKFTITTAKLTADQWRKIAAAAGSRAQERTQAAKDEAAASAAKLRAPTGATPTAFTGQTIYNSLIATYNANTKGKTASDPTMGSRTYWNNLLSEKLGLLSTDTPSRAEVETAFKALLAQAAAGNKTFTAVIRDQVQQHAATLAAAMATTGKTGKTGQALSDYFVTEFTTIAHTYLVPISDATINQRAALAAQAGTGYESKENEVAGFRKYIQTQAAALYPSFATQINKGVTTQTLLNPYAEVAAKTLGYGTASATETAVDALGITWLDPKWNPALSGGKAETGKLSAPMSLTQWRQHLITTPQYGWSKTATAQQMKLNVGQSLAQAFGVRKS